MPHFRQQSVKMKEANPTKELAECRMRDAEYVIHPWEEGGQPREKMQSLEPNSYAQLLEAAHGTMSKKAAN